jgi:hypothetical protein
MIETDYSLRRAYYAARYQASKTAGVCVVHGCGVTARAGKTQCEKHGKRSREYWEAYGKAERTALRKASAAALALLFVFASIRTAGAQSDVPQAAPVAPVESRYCVRDDEPLPARIERLRTALRLAELEQRVNRKAGRR